MFYDEVFKCLISHTSLDDDDSSDSYVETVRFYFHLNF